MVGTEKNDLGITHLKSRPCLYNNIIHVGGADITKGKRQGDEIRGVETNMVLPNEPAFQVRLPSQLQKLPIVSLLALCTRILWPDDGPGDELSARGFSTRFRTPLGLNLHTPDMAC
jgi:hypothetical protein